MSNSKPVHRRFLFLVLAVCVSATASAQTRPKRTDIGAAPTGILWVGNSFFYYNNSMHNHVSNLVRAADPKIAPRATSVTISGSGIDWHDMESYFRPEGIGKYSFVGDNEIVFNKIKNCLRLYEKTEEMDPKSRELLDVLQRSAVEELGYCQHCARALFKVIGRSF